MLSACPHNLPRPYNGFGQTVQGFAHKSIVQGRGIFCNKKRQGAKELQLLAVMRKEFLTKTYSPDREIEDMSIFRDIEFLEFSRKSDVTQRMIKLLGDYKTSQYKIENAKHCLSISEISTSLM